MEIMESTKRLPCTGLRVSPEILREVRLRKGPEGFRLFYLKHALVPGLRWVPTEDIDNVFLPIKFLSNFNLREEERYQGEFLITIKPVNQVPYSNGVGMASEYRLNIFILRREGLISPESRKYSFHISATKPAKTREFIYRHEGYGYYVYFRRCRE
mgnify:CR=1 FL=1